MKSESWLSSIN